MKITIEETGTAPELRLMITFGDMFVWETTPVDAGAFGQKLMDKARAVYGTVTDDPRHAPEVIDVGNVSALVMT